MENNNDFYIELEVGSIFRYKSDMLKVEENKNNDCKGCYFLGKFCDTKRVGHCCGISRPFDNNVIFKKI